MSKTIEPAVLAERQRLRAQVRSLGLARNAVIENGGVNWTPQECEALAENVGPLETRHAVVQFRDVEFRDATGTGDGSYTLTGYAAVYGQETILYDGSWWRLREVIAPAAFEPVLSRSPDVHLNIGHDMTRAIARTGVDGVGGLELTSDTEGLRVFARLDPADPDVISLAAKMNRKIVDQMSFAFTIARAKYESEIDEENDFEDELRTILEIGELYDTAVCAQGAYAQTSAELAMRSFTSALGRAGVDLAGLLEHRDTESGAVTPVAPEGADEAAEEPEAPSAPEDGGNVDAPEAGGDQRAKRARTAAAMRMRIAIDDRA